MTTKAGIKRHCLAGLGITWGVVPELEYMHHVPNGGKRDRATAVALKRQGVKAGVPDMFCQLQGQGITGFTLSLKLERIPQRKNQAPLVRIYCGSRDIIQRYVMAGRKRQS